jgi:hypothetical protein
VLRIPANRRSGFLLPVVDVFGYIWSNFLTVWSWTPIFHQPLKKPAGQREVSIAQNNVLHDICWCVSLALATYFIFRLLPGRDVATDSWILIAFSYSSWRSLDLAVVLMHGTLFGYKNRPGTREVMTLQRAQRRLLVSLIHFGELILFYAVIYWVLYQRFKCRFNGFAGTVTTPYQALLVSFSTLTTIGYGTYAPDQTPSVLVAMLQSFTGLLLIGGFIAQMSSLLKAVHAETEPKEAEEEEEETTEVSFREYRLRRVVPPLATFLGIVLIWCLASKWPGCGG